MSQRTPENAFTIAMIQSTTTAMLTAAQMAHNKIAKSQPMPGIGVNTA